MIRALLIYLFLLPFICFSQSEQEKQQRIDSLTVKFRKDSSHIYRFQQLRPYVNIDGRNSYINGKSVVFKGLQLGFIGDEVHTLGMGFYGITQNSKRPYAATDGTLSVQKSLSMNYLTLFYMYALVDKKYYEVDVPVEFGLGHYDITFHDSLNTHVYRHEKGPIIPLGIGIQPTFKPVRWVGMALLMGYRVVLEGNQHENFNGFYFSVGLNFDVRQIIRDIRYSNKKKKYRRAVQAIINL